MAKHVTLTDGRIPLNDHRDIVSGVSMMTIREGHLIVGKSRHVALPVHEKWVQVTVGDPEGEIGVVGVMPRTDYQITTLGKSGVIYRWGYLEPRTVRPRGLVHQYDTDASLRADYAQSMAGALVVADLVAVALENAHGTMTDTAAFPVLLDRWQEVHPEGQRDPNPNLAFQLPADVVRIL